METDNKEADFGETNGFFFNSLRYIYNIFLFTEICNHPFLKLCEKNLYIFFPKLYVGWVQIFSVTAQFKTIPWGWYSGILRLVSSSA